jgi:hypothetical protein
LCDESACGRGAVLGDVGGFIFQRNPFFKSGCSGTRVQGSGFRVQGLGFRVQGSGFRVQGSGFRVQG